jgi:hypothetical protein
VVAWLAKDATVAADVGGRIWSDEGPEGEDLPFLRIVDPEDSVSTFGTGKGYYDTGSIQIDVYAEDSDTEDGKDRARRIGWDVADALNNAPLVFSRGRLRYFRQAGPPKGERDPDPGPNGRPVYHQFVVFHYFVARALP